ncbi:hypothetical protein PCANC_27394 [Puccinia coronata f. sp. avenae]|uniref:Protein kinase domain-containing protein n=1 Tax=Puccinia coronata f. sp. avenae TaxID=200324 RepID=A0A2N5RUK5_9BASI|nr:hypothetical protein PCANC_27394 [Puccinia coronata f. sp. avenae]
MKQMASPSSHQSSKQKNYDIPDILPGGYTIGNEIGRGSFAVVYLGQQKQTIPSNSSSQQQQQQQQPVAIKVVIKSKLTNKLFQNLQDESKSLKG